MNVYEYVAESNPQIAEQIMNSFDYDAIDAPDMGLSQLVERVGKPAFKKIMANHPDKDVILELYGSDNSKNKEQKTCGCDGCKVRSREAEHLQYLNLTGKGTFADDKSNASTTNTHLLANQTNVILVVSALFIATALILKNK